MWKIPTEADGFNPGKGISEIYIELPLTYVVFGTPRTHFGDQKNPLDPVAMFQKGKILIDRDYDNHSRIVQYNAFELVEHLEKISKHLNRSIKSYRNVPARHEHFPSEIAILEQIVTMSPRKGMKVTPQTREMFYKRVRPAFYSFLDSRYP